MINKIDLEKMLALFEKNIGEKKSELNYENYYQFAVAVLLSAQATDKSVNIATKALFELIKTPEDMIKLGEENLKNYIKTVGLFNSKARHIIQMAEMLVGEFNATLPSTRDELILLAGIGRKSANVIMNELYGTPTIGVDTHVLRLVKRLDLVEPHFTTPEQVEMALEEIIPLKYKPFIGNYLVLYGRYECKAKKPNCSTCYIREFCKDKETQNKELDLLGLL